MDAATAGTEKETVTAQPAVDFGVLAAAVADAVTGPRAGRPQEAAVAVALRRRAEGATFTAIAEAIGVSEKRVRLWCRVAEQRDSRFDARGAKPRRVRAAAATRPQLGKMIGFRPRQELREQLEQRAAEEGTTLTNIVEAAVSSYLSRKTPNVGLLVKRQLRKNLAAELAVVGTAVAEQRLELTAQGRNLNQLVRLCNEGRVPVGVRAEIEATQAALGRNTEVLAALHAAVRTLVGLDEGDAS
ncbi:hypothetical protein [Gordonia amicalis]|uniref:Uncharacterized protein n=1 Tax=Gordonia amicalis TaxID=89053 RepID=A0ABU4DEC0_9ACTN|nr:hypothetical protein [Gordonia amicalis]MDV6308091.1 hypothetical protein [Gordonia amicalis]